MVDIFDESEIHFMGSFRKSLMNKYILICVNPISKWVEAIPTRINETRVVIMFL